MLAPWWKSSEADRRAREAAEVRKVSSDTVRAANALLDRLDADERLNARMEQLRDDVRR